MPGGFRSSRLRTVRFQVPTDRVRCAWPAARRVEFGSVMSEHQPFFDMLPSAQKSDRPVDSSPHTSGNPVFGMGPSVGAAPDHTAVKIDFKSAEVSPHEALSARCISAATSRTEGRDGTRRVNAGAERGMMMDECVHACVVCCMCVSDGG